MTAARRAEMPSGSAGSFDQMMRLKRWYSKPLHHLLHTLKRSIIPYYFGFALNRAVAVEGRQRSADNCEKVGTPNANTALAARHSNQMLTGVARVCDEIKRRQVRQLETSLMTLLPSMREPPPRAA
jgi:hypothetical protein